MVCQVCGERSGDEPLCILHSQELNQNKIVKCANCQMYYQYNQECPRCSLNIQRDTILVSSGVLQFWGKRLFKIGKTGKDFNPRNPDAFERYEKIIRISGELKNYWDQEEILQFALPETLIQTWIASLKTLSDEGLKSTSNNFDWSRYNDILLISKELNQELISYKSKLEEKSKGEKIQTMRDDLNEKVTSNKITRLDRYQALFAFLFGVLFSLVGYFIGNLPFLVYCDFFLTAFFVASYMIGRAKQALDIRLLVISSFFQFIYLFAIILCIFFTYPIFFQAISTFEYAIGIILFTIIGFVFFLLFIFSNRIGFSVTSRIVSHVLFPLDKLETSGYDKLTYLIYWAMPRNTFYLAILGIFFYFQFPILLNFPFIHLYITVPFVALLIDWIRRILKAQTRLIDGDIVWESFESNRYLIAFWISIFILILSFGSISLFQFSEPIEFITLGIILNLILIGLLSDLWNSD